MLLSCMLQVSSANLQFFFISSHLIKNHLSPCLFKGFFFFRFSHSNDFIHFFFNFLFDSNTCLPQFLKETLTSLFPFCSLLFSPLLFSLRWRWTSPNKFTFFLSCSSSSSMIPICTFCNLSFNFRISSIFFFESTKEFCCSEHAQRKS